MTNPMCDDKHNSGGISATMTNHENISESSGHENTTRTLNHETFFYVHVSLIKIRENR